MESKVRGNLMGSWNQEQRDMEHRVHGELTSMSVVTANVTAVEVNLRLGRSNWIALGDAKRHPKDDTNYEIGMTLAYARALRQLADNLERHGEMLVRQNCPRESLEQIAQSISDAYERSL